MELTNATAHRALAYVAAVQRQGYVMSVDELEAYLREPSRRPGTPGTPEQRIVTTNVGRSLGRAVEPLMQGLSAQIARALDPREEWIPSAPGTPGESIADWLARLCWLRVNEGRVRVTSLGQAILAHLEQASLEDEIPLGVVLNRGDELATARVIQQLAEIGPCAVVDRYFSMESLLPILHSTQVEAVLMGGDAGGKLVGVETALRGMIVERPFEVRKSDVFHDRFVIPADGPVWLLGTSLTGLSKRLSVMVQIDNRLSDAIRREFQEAWEASELVAAKQPEPAVEPSEAEPPMEPPEAEQVVKPLGAEDTRRGDSSGEASEPNGGGPEIVSE